MGEAWSSSHVMLTKVAEGAHLQVPCRHQGLSAPHWLRPSIAYQALCHAPDSC